MQSFSINDLAEMNRLVLAIAKYILNLTCSLQLTESKVQDNLQQRIPWQSLCIIYDFYTCIQKSIQLRLLHNVLIQNTLFLVLRHSWDFVVWILINSRKSRWFTPTQVTTLVPYAQERILEICTIESIIKLNNWITRIAGGISQSCYYTSN